MKTAFLLLWQVIYPVVVVCAAPFWLLKMYRRGGWGSGLLERIGIYSQEAEYERQGSIYLHSVSVGETLLALRLIEVWKKKSDDHFTLVPTTATGLAVAKERAPAGVRVIYAPLDFPFLIRRVMKRFAPKMVIMLESELWPNLINETSKLGIPVGLANARLSPRSGRRLRKFRSFVEPFLSQLQMVVLAEEEEIIRWEKIGVPSSAVRAVGNLKFDSAGGALPRRRSEFTEILEFLPARPVGLAVSTFAGEEELIDRAFREVGLTSVIVPRHAERRDEVQAALSAPSVLKTRFRASELEGNETVVIDTTGELRDWTAHADVVVIGKSFLAEGGQNPSEAIQAGVPVICGPKMANFEPLVSQLREVGGISQLQSGEELPQALERLLKNPESQVEAAQKVLKRHEGALARTVDCFINLV